MPRAAVLKITSIAHVRENLQLLDFFLKAKKACTKLWLFPENFAFMGAYAQDDLQCLHTLRREFPCHDHYLEHFS